MVESRYVEKDEVLGRRLLEIKQCWSMCPESGFDYAWSYCRLDSGLIIALRYESIVAEEQPADAEPIAHRWLEHIYRQPIVGAWLAPDDCNWVDERTPYLSFANGFAISDIPVAPHGVGGVGIVFFEPGELELNTFRPYWQ